MRRQKIPLSPLLLLGLSLALCLVFVFFLTRSRSLPPTIAEVSYSPSTNLRDIPYGTALDPLTNQPVQLTLDYYTPKSTVPTPAIIWIHGGGFNTGDKSIFSNLTGGNGYAKHYADLGYAGFAINYRLGSHTYVWNDPDLPQIISTAQADTQTAMQFLLDHAQEFNLNPHQIILAGSSAGAITALYAGLDNPPFRPAAIISYSGSILPSDLSLVDPTDPPVLLLHGKGDTTVPYASAENLANRLAQQQVPYFFKGFAGVSHSLGSVTQIHPLTEDFLSTYLPLARPLSPPPSSHPSPSTTSSPVASLVPSPTPSSSPSPLPPPSSLPSPSPSTFTRSSLTPSPSPTSPVIPSRSPLPSPSILTPQVVMPSTPPRTSPIPAAPQSPTPIFAVISPTPSPSPSSLPVVAAPSIWEQLWQALLSLLGL